MPEVYKSPPRVPEVPHVDNPVNFPHKIIGEIYQNIDKKYRDIIKNKKNLPDNNGNYEYPGDGRGIGFAIDASQGNKPKTVS